MPHHDDIDWRYLIVREPVATIWGLLEVRPYGFPPDEEADDREIDVLIPLADLPASICRVTDLLRAFAALDGDGLLLAVEGPVELLGRLECCADCYEALEQR